MIVTVIELSAIIWNVDDLNSARIDYWSLSTEVIDLLDSLESRDLHYLLRQNLLFEIYSKYPYMDVNRNFEPFTVKVMNFLSNISERIIDLDSDFEEQATSSPSLRSSHFTPEIKSEIDIIINNLHFTDKDFAYFTFQPFWGGGDSDLMTTCSKCDKTHDTVVCHNNDVINDYFTSKMLKFVPSPKHNFPPNQKRFHKGNPISPLSCTDVQAQELLNKALEVDKDKYIAYFEPGKVCVVFRRHHGNYFHAHDETNPMNVPKFFRSLIN